MTFPIVGSIKRLGAPAGSPFIFTVTVGSAESFQLPTVSDGLYDALIDWGDTTSNSLTVWNEAGRSHTYATGGVYEIRISGVFDGWDVNNYADRLKITEVKQWGVLLLGNGSNAFTGCSNLTITATDILDTSACTNFSRLFSFCSSLTDVPNIGLWDTSNVVSFGGTSAVPQGCFSGCSNFNGDVSGWDTSAATNFYKMFVGCSVFNRDLNTWDMSIATILTEMFNLCSVFNGDVTTWNTSNVQSFNQVFRNCSAFNQDIGGWDTSSGENFTNMFVRAYAFDQDLSDWNVENAISFFQFFFDNGLSTANYDALLIGWAAQTVNSGVTLSMANSKYTPGGAAEAARDTLINTYGWTITDGGPA